MCPSQDRTGRTHQRKPLPVQACYSQGSGTEPRLQRLTWLALGHGVTVKDSRCFAIYLVSGVDWLGPKMLSEIPSS